MPLTYEDKYIWDSWFFEAEDELHAFYLQANKSDCKNNPENRHNLACIGHSIYRNNIWAEARPQIALSKTERKAWDSLSLWTGSVLFNENDQTYYLFYTARDKDQERLWTPREIQHPQHIGLATSKDLCIWERHPQSLQAPIIPAPSAPFDGVNWRDPFVYKGESGNFYVFITTRLQSDSTEGGSVIAYLEAEKIDKWNNKKTQILIQSDDFYQMEVPQFFSKTFGNKKRYYLLFCALNLDCSNKRKSDLPPEESQTGTYYMYSEEFPLDHCGLPKEWSRASILKQGLYSGKILKVESNAPELWGFPHSGSDKGFVGGICDPLKVSFKIDGSIKIKDNVK